MSFDANIAKLKRRLSRLGVPSHCYGITKDGSRHVLRTTIGGVVKEHQLGINTQNWRCQAIARPCAASVVREGQ